MNSYQPFTLSRLPRIVFGRGVFAQLPEIIQGYGSQVLLITGAAALQETTHWSWLCTQLQQQHIRFHHSTVHSEPSPQYVDNVVEGLATQAIDVVVGIGGGSALDAAKAIAGLLRIGDSVMDYLEGVGPERDYAGPAVPYIAMPTTAGTGSETTKNAVLSIRGKEGFKKSFRDDKLVAEYAVVDPDLLISCPPDLIAANGMDALTQLMESYTSLRANPMTNALAVSGLRAARDGLLAWYDNAHADPEVTEAARTKMAYASMLSGITLAQVGLGSVHGLASPLGAFFPIPHGVVCGTLVAEATHTNIQAMRDREPDNPALRRYVRLAEIICAQRFRDPQLAWHMLVERLMAWTEHMRLARLAEYEVSQSDLDHIVAHSRGSSMKTNPIVLSDAELQNILERRL